MIRSDVPAVFVAAMVALRGLLTLPGSYWQAEEVRFGQALLTYDGSAPLFVAAGRLVNFFLRDPFASLVALSLAMTIGGAILLTRAAGELLGDAWSGAAAALILYLSPAMLVFTPLPNAEAFDVALVALVLFAVARRLWPLLAIALVALVIELWAPLPSITSEPLPQLLLRFVAHPWGSKFLAFPLLLAAAAGVVVLRRRFMLAAIAALFAGVCVATGSLTAGVQPVLPALALIALFAAASLSRWPIVAVVAALVYGGASIVYVRPILEARRGVSPPAAATAFAERSLPAGAVLLADPRLAAHASVIEERIRVAPVEELARHGGQPVYRLVQGGMPGARVFSWPESDAYGKITPEDYRVVSLQEIEPRYVPRSGVYALESTVPDGAWHWLAPEAAVDLSDHVSQVELRLPVASPVPSVTVRVNEAEDVIARGASATVRFLPTTRLEIRSSTSWRAGGRDLSVQLLSIDRR